MTNSLTFGVLLMFVRVAVNLFNTNLSILAKIIFKTAIVLFYLWINILTNQSTKGLALLSQFSPRHTSKRLDTSKDVD